MEANNEEEVEEPTLAEDPAKETQSKNRKKKAQAKKQMEGELVLCVFLLRH